MDSSHHRCQISQTSLTNQANELLHPSWLGQEFHALVHCAILLNRLNVGVPVISNAAGNGSNCTRIGFGLDFDFHEVKNKLLFAVISFEFNSAMRQTLH